MRIGEWTRAAGIGALVIGTLAGGCSVDSNDGRGEANASDVEVDGVTPQKLCDPSGGCCCYRIKSTLKCSGSCCGADEKPPPIAR